MGKQQLHLELDEATRLVLDKLRDRMGARSRTEAVRRVVRFVYKVQEPGSRFIVRSADGAEREVTL